MLPDGGILLDSLILIRPEYFSDFACQYESGMNFTLAAQGYLSGGLPEPFAKQPLYRTIFQEKHQKYRPMVDPCTLKAFLATYQVQYVVLTARAIDYETYWVRNIGASGWAEPNKERTKIKHS